jgi:hypothetical protein
MRKKAVFTNIKNENTFLPIWLKYYSNHFDEKDIYLLDFGSEESYLKKYKNLSVINAKAKINHWFDNLSEIFDEVRNTHNELLQSYEHVLFCEADEIIHHPSGLGNYIDETNHEYTTCTGYEIIHLPDKEPNLDLSKPILSQRNYWYREYFHFSKTLLSSKPLKWGIGYHNTEEPKRFEQDFILIHLHKWDYDFCLNRHLNWGNTNWSQKSIDEDNCWHYQIRDREKFDEWYYMGLKQSNLELIPQEIKESVLL